MKELTVAAFHAPYCGELMIIDVTDATSSTDIIAGPM